MLQFPPIDTGTTAVPNRDRSLATSSPSDRPIAIRVQHLHKRFAQQRSIAQTLRNAPVQWSPVLQDVSFEVGRGEVFGVLGTNGAGKTTLTRILCTMVLPDRGTVEIDTLDVTADPLSIRKRVGYVTCAEKSFEERISARDNLHFFGALNDLDGDVLARRVAEAFEQVGLLDAADKTVRSFSTGMKQKLAIARALLHNPQILFLDEPTSGLDPLAADRFRRFLQQLAKEQQRTIFLCTHMPDEIQLLCDRVLFLHKGRSLASGTLDAVRRQIRDRPRYTLTLLDEPTYTPGCQILPGVTAIDCEPVADRWRLELEFDADLDDRAVTEMLRHVMESDRLSVIECRKQELSLADLYAALTEPNH